MSEWISTDGELLPPYGTPVLIITNGVVQHVTYVLDGFDNAPDWFEPMYFDHDNELKIRWDKVSYWSELPEPPE